LANLHAIRPNLITLNTELVKFPEFGFGEVLNGLFCRVIKEVVIIPIL